MPTQTPPTSLLQAILRTVRTCARMQRRVNRFH